MTMMVVAMLMLPGIDAIAKWLSTSISSGQVTWSRFFFQVLLMLPFFLRTRGPWLTSVVFLHAVRGGLIAFATLLFFSGLKYLPIADAISIFFIEPLLVTLLSAVLLGESIGWRRLSAVTIGFVGAMIIIRPAFETFGWPVLLPLGTALCFSFYIILTRSLVQREDPVRLQFFTGVFGCLVMTLALVFGAFTDIPVLKSVWPEPSQWLLLAGLGLIATIGHFLVVHAFRRAPVSVLAPFQYVEIVGAIVLGLVIFDDFPDLTTWLGVTIIVASGVYVFHRESKLSQRGISKDT
jgi:S-adenosylmethionine uptake transporter